MNTKLSLKNSQIFTSNVNCTNIVGRITNINLKNRINKSHFNLLKSKFRFITIILDVSVFRASILQSRIHK